MALTAITLYAPDRTTFAILIVAAVFGLVNLPCVSLWALLGQQLRRILRSPSSLKIFNWTMAILLVASLYPVVFGA
jgi:threonine/homoserine/homoserine lactone efflux protein